VFVKLLVGKLWKTGALALKMEKQNPLLNKKVSNNSMNIKFLLVALTLLMLFPMLSAEVVTTTTPDFVVKQNDCLNLIQTCALCSQNNITNVVYPNTTQALGLVEMDKDGSVYNYTFCGTSATGTYVVNGIGDLEGDGVGVIWRYTFEVNPTGGLEDNTTLFIIFILVSTGLLLLAFLFKNYVFAIISGFSYLLTGVYTMINGLGSIATTNTQMLSVVILGFGAIVLITSALELAGESYGGKTNDDF